MKKSNKPSTKFKKTPQFKSEKEEQLFWQKADSTEYIDWSQAEKWTFPNLKLSSTPITIRMPDALLARVKVRAHQQDVPYQTLIKQLIYSGLA